MKLRKVNIDKMKALPIIDLHLQGLQLKEIALRLNRTVDYVGVIMNAPNFQHTLLMRKRRKERKMKKVLTGLILGFGLVLVCISGCTKSVNEDGKTVWGIDLGKSAQIEDAVDAGSSLLSIIYPPATAVALTILTALGIYRKKIKPHFEKVKTEANLYHTSTHTLVQVIETIKKDQPELWKKLEPFLESRIGVNTENVIRAIRGLSPKE